MTPDIVLCPGGPMLVRGDVTIQDAEGRVHHSDRPVTALCRCNKSAQKPWCDGTHQLLADKHLPEKP